MVYQSICSKFNQQLKLWEQLNLLDFVRNRCLKKCIQRNQSNNQTKMTYKGNVKSEIRKEEVSSYKLSSSIQVILPNERNQ